MTRKRVHLGPDAPDMQIVDIAHALHLLHRFRQQIHAHSLGSALEQYVERLANNTERRPKDQRPDSKGKYWINPGLPSKENHPSTDNHRRRRKSVSQHVNECAADIDVVAAAVKHQRDDAVHRHTSSGYYHHSSGMYMHRVHHAPRSLNEDVNGDDHQSEGIYKSRQNS